MLFYLDSNQDKQDQNLLCYHYTIEQYLTNRQLSCLRVQRYILFQNLQINLRKKCPEKRRTCFFKSL